MTESEGIDPRAEGGREKILDAALHLFATRGYGNTPTKAISEHAGVATGLVFYHFSSKDELLQAVLAERSIASELAGLGVGLPDDATRALHVVGRRLVELLRDNAAFVTVAVGAGGHLPEALELLRDGAGRLAAQLGAHLAAVTGARKPAASTAARVFVGSLLSTVLLLPPAGSDRTLVRAHATAVLVGLESSG